MDLASSTPPPAAAGVPGVPSRRMLGEAGIDSARRRVHDCERPIRLRGATQLVNPATGEIRTLYASAQELDGTTWVPCGNRRAAACGPCSRQYQGDAWQLVTTGLAGGKGIPASVAEHPCTFATLTAPSCRRLGLEGAARRRALPKIRMADEVYIVDPGGYVGESTRREITYAESLGKPVRYLSRERLAQTGDGPRE